ncbi:MAG: preprotein translocase subunit SecE [Pseudomonadota bacterium]
MAKKHNPGSKKPGVRKKKKKAAPDSPAAEPESPTIEAKADAPKKKSVGPFEFLQQVRNEGEKVTWTSRNETMVSTVMVLIMVMIMSLFFFLVDQILRFGVGNLLSIGATSI